MADRPTDEVEAALVDFVQRVAMQRKAVCALDHHAGTCRGAVNLADEALKLLAGLGIEPRYPRRRAMYSHSCWVCGGVEYVLGQVWRKEWVHAQCMDDLAERINQ